MKKILAILVALSAAGYLSAIEVNDNLSINGFIDASYSNTDTDGAANDVTDLDVDEVEINFLFNAGGVSAEVHVDDDDGDAAASSVNIEQAHLSYGFEGGLTMTLGRFGSNLGLEREDPGGLYTYSRAYDDGTSARNLGNVDANAQEGLRIGYAAEQFSASLSATNPIGTAEENAGGENDLDFELAIAFTGMENLAIGGGMQSGRSNAGDVDVTTLNASYTVGSVLLAGEWLNIDDEVANTDLDAWLLLADYDVSDVLGVTVRYSEWETAAAAQTDKLTIAPNYSITDSLGAILEYSSSDNGAGADENTLALELTFTF